MALRDRSNSTASASDDKPKAPGAKDEDLAYGNTKLHIAAALGNEAEVSDLLSSAVRVSSFSFFLLGVFSLFVWRPLL